MSSAIKRLSTIIRPSASSPSSPTPKETKSSIDAPAPAAPVDGTTTADVKPATEVTVATETANDNSKPSEVVANAAPEQGATVVPSTIDATKDEAPAAEPTKDAEAGSAPQSKKEKDTKGSHRRDPRDIGLSTIRRFSSILRQSKDIPKDTPPPVPAQSTTQDDNTKLEAESVPAEPTIEVTSDVPKEEVAVKENNKEEVAPAEKDAKATDSTTKRSSESKDKSKVNKRRSSFFTAAREGLQRTAKDVQTRARRQPSATKPKVVTKVDAVPVPKIVKKGAAKGKRVIVITGASKGVGLEFVKQFAIKPNTFVIALSRTAEKSPALKPIVSASAKEGHNVRAIKLDVSSTRSINNVIKDIIELTDGRVDLLINAAGTTGNPTLKIWDIKGNELEEELRNNLVGPIAFTNALLPYLKPLPQKVKKEETAAEHAKEDSAATAQDKPTSESIEAKVDASEKKVDAPEGLPVVEASAQPTAAEHAPIEPAATSTEAAPTTDPASTTDAAVPTDDAPTSTDTTPTEPEPAFLPSQPFILFLAPSQPIQNVSGAATSGSGFAPAPLTLFSLSRSALQVAIAKYAIGLAGRGLGVVGVERQGLDDPHSTVTEEQAAKGVLALLPELQVKDNGKLLKA